MNLTPHFTLEELTFTEHREFDNTPGAWERENLTRLADFLEQIRALLNGRPIVVNSAYRSRLVNAAVGSKDSSQHRIGCAADFRVPGMSPDAVVRKIKGSALPFDQLIREYDRWTHVSIPNTMSTPARRQALIIDRETPNGRPFV